MLYEQVFEVVSLIWGPTATLLLISSWYCARSDRITTHRVMMILLIIGSYLFLALYLLRYRIETDAPNLPPEYIPWLALHGTLGLVPIFGGSWLIASRLMQFKSSAFANAHHRVIGRTLILIWIFTNLGGLFNWWVLY